MSSSALGFRAVARERPEYAGTVRLTAARYQGKTHPVRTEGSGVLRLLHPLYLDDSGQLSYFVVNPGGAYFGEALRFDVEVEDGAHFLLSSQGATRIYRTPKEPAFQDAAFTVGAGARFEYVPDQTIAYRDADYRQRTTLTLETDSQAFVGEIVTPGWDPDGKPFTYTAMRLRFDILHPEAGFVLEDNVRIIPAELGSAIEGIGYMEGFSHMGSALAVGPQTADPAYLEQIREIVERHPTARAGATSGSRHGVSWVMMRALGNSTDTLHEMILDINEYDRSVTTGQGRLHLRRY